MGGKQSRHQREQKHQLRKAKKEKKLSTGGDKKASGVDSDTLEPEQLLPASSLQTAPSGVGLVTQHDNGGIPVPRIVPNANAERAEDEEEQDDITKSSVTITICMLKMEPNVANSPPTEEAKSSSDIVTVTDDSVESVDDQPATTASGCGCVENGNVGGTLAAGCSCNSSNTPSIGNNNSKVTIDNRLNNNEPQHLPAQGTLVSSPSNGSIATPAAPCSSANEPTLTPTVAAATLARRSSNLSTMSSPNGAAPSSPASLSFMIGGHDPATISHLLHQLRHLHHQHHHHHHHLMHLHHVHHHHGVAAEIPLDGTMADGWRQHLRQPWNPAGVAAAGGFVVRPADLPATNGTSLGTPTGAQFMDIDIELKDKLEGLKLGNSSVTAPRSSNNNLVEATGEHPYSVGECPTCCAMAMAANASGSLGGLLAPGSGATSSLTNGSTVCNGNVGEVEEKILNTSNQPLPVSDAAGGEKVPDDTTMVTPTAAVTSLATIDNNPSVADPATAAATSPRDQISTDAGNAPQAGSSLPASTAAATAAAAGTSSNDDGTGKDVERTVAPATDGNSSKPTTPATSITGNGNEVASSSPDRTTDSPPTNTSTVGTAVASTSTTTISSKPTPCCNRKQSSSAAATLFSSLSLAGRRSRSSHARNGSCCANNATAEGAESSTVSSPEQQRSFTNWISGSGGHKQQQRNGNGAGGSKSSRSSNGGAVNSTGNGTVATKSKKPNWRISLNCTISLARAAGSAAAGHSSKSAGSGSSGQGMHKSTGKASQTQSSTGSSTSTTNASADSTTTTTSNGSAGPSLRGSSLISGGVSSKLLKGDTDKDDSCVCTAYRKMSESPPPPASVSPLPSVAATASASPARVTSPRPATESVEWFEEAMQGSGLLPLNIHMLNSLRAGSSGGGSTTSPPIAGGAVPGPLISLSPEPLSASMLPNHHHHHHHAMALVADHHQSFFFPSAAGASNHHAHHGPPGTAGLFGALPLGSNHSPANDVILLSDSPVVFDLSSDDFSVEDCDERARIQRELEIREGVDAPPNFHPRRLMSGGTITAGPAANHPIAFIYSRDLMQRGLLVANKLIQPLDATGGCAGALAGRAGFGRLRIHSQVDFIHCLVPDLQKITSCSFYWGKMDRYEAERLLEGKPEGTFLLRDSAQEEFLFSVSFRKYNRSLHARIEQFNHKFSFDSRDPGVFTASTVTGLLEHYKDPSCVMFFEPMLTFPLNRNFSFGLQQLCRAVIVSNTTYDGINELTLPKSLKAYLKEYHYRQRVRFRPMDEHLYSNA